MASQMLTNDVPQPPSSVRQTPLKELETVTFFKNLYTYPPQINVRIEPLEPLLNKDVKGQAKRDFDIITVKRNKIQNITNYLNEYKTKQSTSTFYRERTYALKKALQNVPVYIVLNSNQEFILANPIRHNSSEKTQNPLKETVYKFACESNDVSNAKEAKLGLFFLNKKDAEMHLQTILSQDPEGSKQIGLTLHCVGLDTAYEIMRQSHVDIDFKFVPNLDELTTFLKKKINDPKIIFDENQCQTFVKNRLVPLSLNFGPLKIKQPTPLISFIQNNEYFKGVPLYIIQYKDLPQNFNEKLQNYTYDKYFRSLIRLGRLEDAIYGRLINTRDFFFGCGQRSIMQGNIETTYNSPKVTNYVFFSLEQASEFIREYEILCKSSGRLKKSYMKISPAK